MESGSRMSQTAVAVDTMPPTTPTATIRMRAVLCHSGTTLGGGGVRGLGGREGRRKVLGGEGEGGAKGGSGKGLGGGGRG